MWTTHLAHACPQCSAAVDVDCWDRITGEPIEPHLSRVALVSGRQKF